MGFNQTYYNYSIKNIPIPLEKLSKMMILEKVELFVKCMRWKAHLFENICLKYNNPMRCITYLKVVKTPSHNVKALYLLKMI